MESTGIHRCSLKSMKMMTSLGALVVLMGGSTGPAATTAFTTAPSFHRHQPQNFHSPFAGRTSTRGAGVGAAAAAGVVGAIPYRQRRPSGDSSFRRGAAAAFNMLHGSKSSSGSKGATAPPTKWAAAARLFALKRGGGGSPGASSSSSSSSSSGNLGIFNSDGGSSGPPRGGGLGRGGGGGGDGEGEGDDGADVMGDMMALGAAQVIMTASDKRSSQQQQQQQPESTLRGGYRRRSAYGRRRMRMFGGSGRNKGITATNVLLALNVVVYAFQTRFPAITKAGWKLAPAITQQGQWYRLLTPVFLHGSLTHLMVNSMSFSTAGPVVENVMGKKKFIAVYALAGVAGNVLSCIVNPRTPAVGASGAIFGMVGAWAAFCIMNETVLGRNYSQGALRNVAQTVMINVVYGMSSSQIDNMGHLGGFLGGAVMTFLIGPRLKRRYNAFTGENYIVDKSFELALPRRRRRDPRGGDWPQEHERRWP